MTPPLRGPRRARLVVLAALVALSAAALAAPADGTVAGAPSAVRQVGRTAYEQNPGNPLAGGTWGVYTGSADGVYPAYQRASGSEKVLLAKIALRPRVRWFGSWMTASDAAAKLRDYIRVTQAGDPDVLVQLAVFRLWPQGEGAKDKPLTAADQDAYRQWVDAAAQAA